MEVAVQFLNLLASQPFGSLARLAGLSEGSACRAAPIRVQSPCPRNADRTTTQRPGATVPGDRQIVGMLASRARQGHAGGMSGGGPGVDGSGQDRRAAGLPARLRLRLLGVGAMASPRYAPAGLLVVAASGAVMVDGGKGAVPDRPASRLSAWLVTDIRAELIADIRRAASGFGLRPEVSSYAVDDLVLTPLPVVHTSHPTWGYLVQWAGRTAVWAPEFWEFPSWANSTDLMFADAAGWSRPIRFRGGAGGHAAVVDTAERARRAGVRRLVFAHIGRPTIRAIDAGSPPAYGEIGREGADYYL